MSLNHRPGTSLDLLKRTAFIAGFAAIAAGVLAADLSMNPAPRDKDNEVALEATVELPPELIARTKQRLDRKIERGPEPQDQPAEAQNFFLFQRMPVDPADYAHLVNKDGKVEMADQTVWVSAEGYYEALSEAQEHIRTEMPWATFGPDGIAMHAPWERTGKAARGLSNWQELGPGNISGRTRALLIDPNTPDTMYAAGVAGGVWKTTDAGANWAPLDDLMGNLAVCTLAFEGQGGASVNTSVIYAGTGEGFFNGDAVRGAGIFKSTNSGATWIQLASTANSDFYYVNKIVASPNTVAVLYAATATGVWKTTGSGGTWTNMLANTGTGTATSTTNTVVATLVGLTDIEVRTDLATDNLVVSNGSFLTDGIYRSTDAGATWDRVHTASGLGRSDLAISPSHQHFVYALSADNNNNHRLLNVFFSSNGGATWSPNITGAFDQAQAKSLLLSNPLAANYSVCYPGFPNLLLSQGWYDNVIAVDPANAFRVYVGGIDLFRSTDAGVTWGLISYWWLDMADQQYAHADQHTIVFHPDYDGDENQTMFVGNDGGIFKTTNAVSGAVATDPNDGICHTPGTPSTVNWTSLNNSYGTIQFYHGRPYPDPTTSYFGGTQDNGTLWGSDTTGPNGWNEIKGDDGGYVSYDPGNTSILFAENAGKSLSRSIDGGATFAFVDIVNGTGQIDGLVDPSGGFPFIAPFRHDPANAERIWYGGQYPWRSDNASSAATNGDVTWTQAGAITPGSGSISAWAVDPNNSDNVWCGMATGEIANTTLGTTSTSTTPWPDVSPPYSWTAFGFPYVSWVEVDGNDATGNTAYVTQSRLAGTTGKHVYRTTNGGTSWTDLTNNLPDIPVHCIVVQPGFFATLFVGTDLGVFASTDSGTTWASANAPGFANVVVEALEFQSPTVLYAFTHGRGAFRATFSTLSLAVTPSDRPVSSSAGSTTFDISLTGAGSTTWTPTTSDPWITSITPSSGSTGDTITVNYAAATGTARQATITVTAPGAYGSPAPVTVSQRGAPQAELEITPASRSVGYLPGSTTYTVENVGDASVTWSSVALDPGSGAVFADWASVTPSTHTSAPGDSTTLTVQYDLNPDAAPRTAMVATSNSDFSVMATTDLDQAANTSFALSVTPSSRPVTGVTGTTTYAVSNTGTGNMDWTAAFDPPVAWAQITSGSPGTNAGTIAVSYLDNPSSSSSRSATITVTAPDAGNSPVQVTLDQQAFPRANLQIVPSSRTVSYPGGSTTFTIYNVGNAPMNWVAGWTEPWITSITQASGTNAGGTSTTVTVNYELNPLATSRTTTISVAAAGALNSPAAVTLAQAGNSSFLLSVTPDLRTVTPPAGTTAFLVKNKGTGSMTWSATFTPAVPWARITSGTSGTNAGTIAVEYDENTGMYDRNAWITVTAPNSANSPATVKLTQGGVPQAWLSVSPTNLSFGYQASSAILTINNVGNAPMQWSAAAHNYKAGSPWFTINPSSGPGNESVRVSYEENPYPASRSGVLRISAPNAIESPIDVNLSQSGNTSLVLSVAPAEQVVGSGTGTVSFAVTNPGGGLMAWSADATGSASWLTIESGASGTNGGAITVHHAENTTDLDRVGTITVHAPGASGNPATVTVRQACAMPALPANMTASDGTYSDRIRLSWSVVAGANAYRVYRHTANDFASATLIGSWTGTQCDDFSATAKSSPKADTGGCTPSSGGGGGNTPYFYWVTGMNTCGQGPPSAPDQGTVGN